MVSLCCFLALMMLGWSAWTQISAAATLPGRTVVLDAGHGGFDPGAVSDAGVRECDINLSITRMLQAELVARGYCVIMTREEEGALGDTKSADMQKRRDIIFESGADYALSIHLNANADSSCYGPVVLYHPGSEEGEKLAQTLQDVLNKGLEIARPRTIQTGNYFILKSGDMPIVIVECGFLSNADDEALLLSPEYQARVAKAIAIGLDAYITDKIDAANAGMPYDGR